MITNIENEELSREQIIERLKGNGNWLKRVEEKTPELCLVAVKSNGNALRFVPDEYKSEEICLIAIKRTYSAMLHIPAELNNIDFWLKAVSVNGEALKHIPKKEQTYTLICKAIKNKPISIRYAANRLIDMKLVISAVSIDGLSLEYVPKKFINDEVIEISIESNGLAIQFVEEPLEGLYFKAIESNPQAIEFMPDELKNEEICLKVINHSGKLIEFIPSALINYDICEAAIENGASLMDIPSEYYNEELYIKAVSFCGDEIFNVPMAEINDHIVDIAIKTSWKAYNFLQSSCFSTEAVMDFLISALNDYKAKNFFSLNEREILNNIVSLFPEKVVCNILENESIVKALRVLRITSEQRKYDAETDTLITIETFRNVEIGRITFNTFEEYYNHYSRVLINRIYLPCFEGVENFDQAILHQYNLRYSKSENRFVEALSPHEENLVGKLQSIDVENISLPLPSSNEEICVSEHDLSPLEEVFPASTFYYISDIHLIHKLKKHIQSLSDDEVYDYIERTVTRMTSGVESSYGNYSGPLLLVAGDVSSDFNITKLFYSCLSKHWQPERIIAILGNHELWGFECKLNDIIEKYYQMFKELNITFLHNEILFVDRTIISEKWRNQLGLNKTHFKLTYNDVLEMQDLSKDEINELFGKTSFAILGGLGFSGLNPKYNAELGLYRNAVRSLKEDITETEKYASIYEWALKHLSQKRVIVLSHTQVEDWSNHPLQKGWIYINGHTHINHWTDANGIRVYSDNQLGYDSVNYSLKHFYLDSLDYDVFEYYKDGCYVITNEQYMDFNRGMSLSGSGRDGGKIHMLKRSGLYCFLFEDEQRQKLYFLSGGVINNIDNQEIAYYYNNMETYANLLKSVSQSRQNILVNISNAVKQLGGTGTIHGSIVDIDYYNHIYFNLFNGNITPYYATSITDKYSYENIPSLLKARLPYMYNRYIKMLNSNSNAALTKNDGEVAIVTTPVKYISTDIYKPSLIMKKIQALLEKNVIRIWDESIFEAFSQNPRLQ